MLRADSGQSQLLAPLARAVVPVGSVAEALRSPTRGQSDWRQELRSPQRDPDYGIRLAPMQPSEPPPGEDRRRGNEKAGGYRRLISPEAGAKRRRGQGFEEVKLEEVKLEEVKLEEAPWRAFDR